MIHLIDKAKVVAEIEKRREEWLYGSSIEAKYKKEECDDILSFLDTLELKEVDLEKEYEEFVEEDPVYSKLVNDIVGKAIARHFFKLGLITQKGGEE